MLPPCCRGIDTHQRAPPFLLLPSSPRSSFLPTACRLALLGCSPERDRRGKARRARDVRPHSPGGLRPRGARERGLLCRGIFATFIAGVDGARLCVGGAGRGGGALHAGVGRVLLHFKVRRRWSLPSRRPDTNCVRTNGLGRSLSLNRLSLTALSGCPAQVFSSPGRDLHCSRPRSGVVSRPRAPRGAEARTQPLARRARATRRAGARFLTAFFRRAFALPPPARTGARSTSLRRGYRRIPAVPRHRATGLVSL